MEAFLSYLLVFGIGGTICLICQIIIDKTKIKPARLLVGLVAIGVLLVAFGAADAVTDFAKSGITTPIIGYGINLARGVKAAVDKEGLLGVLKGGLSANSAGVTAVIILAFLAAVFSSPKEKK